MLLSHYLNIAFHQTAVSLKQESQRFFLGVAWWFLDPLLYILVFYILFRAGLRFGEGDSMVGIVAAIAVWRLFAGTISPASASLLTNRSLMNQIDLPKWIFPVQVFLTSAFKFSFLLVILLTYLWLVGVEFSLMTLGFIPVLLIYMSITLGVSLITAAVVPFLPDLRFLISNGITFIFFLSGVFYNIESFPEETQRLFYLNPFAVIMTSVKRVLVFGSSPMWQRLVFVAGLAIAFVLLGFYLLNRYSKVYPKMTRG